MYIEKIYILSIIFVITITFINEIAPLDILMDIRTILLIALVMSGIFLARGPILYMSICLLSIGHIGFVGFTMAQSTPYNYDVYQPRNPKASAYYKCVENHFEELERAWDDMYASRYGFCAHTL
jgi:hypothetical protein